MDKLQADIEKQILENEKEVLKELKDNYTKSLKEIKQRIKELQSSEFTQSKIYQIQYQQNLEKQLTALIEVLSNDNVNTINDFLIKNYKDGFIGTLYHMQEEGVPFIMPLDQESIVKSIQRKTEDMNLSQRLYKNANELKKNIKAEITRGLSQALNYSKIARNISLYSEANMNKAYRIARTEGGRVQSEAKFEAMQRAKINGADVVKQWDSTIDKRTRMTHIQLDGQIRNLEEPFEVNGNKAMYPHGFGIAEEDINCRCALLERARWAVEDEENFTKIVDGDLVEFKDVKNYRKKKKKYFNFYEKHDKITKENVFDILDIDANNYKASESNNIQEQVAKLLGMGGKPNIVDEDTYEKTMGHEIVRYLRDYKNISAEEAYKNTLYGDIQYSDKQFSQYGRAIYFGEKTTEEKLLHTFGDGKGKAVNAKLSNNAKILEFNSMISYLKDVEQREKNLPEKLRKIYNSERSLLYMLDGYDGIKINGKNYYCIYNRKVLIIKNEQ